MDTEHLPEPLRSYVRGAVLTPRDGATHVHLEQRGEMRLGPDRPWLPFTAEQSIAIHHTAFLWHARVKMARFATAVVEDAFEDGHGRLDAKLWGVVPVAHGRGELFDRGEAQRYLAELPWCPLACVHNRAIQYRRTEERVVRAWLGEEVCHVDLCFDDAGDLVAARTTTRARDERIQPWEGRFSDFRQLGGLRAPSRAEVAWEAPEGHFSYWRGEVLAIDLAGP